MNLDCPWQTCVNNINRTLEIDVTDFNWPRKICVPKPRKRVWFIGSVILAFCFVGSVIFQLCFVEFCIFCRLFFGSMFLLRFVSLDPCKPQPCFVGSHLNVLFCWIRQSSALFSWMRHFLPVVLLDPCFLRFVLLDPCIFTVLFCWICVFHRLFCWILEFRNFRGDARGWA